MEVVFQAIVALIALIFMTLGGILDEKAQDGSWSQQEKLPEGDKIPCPELVEPDARRDSPLSGGMLPPGTGMEDCSGQDRFPSDDGADNRTPDTPLRSLHRM